MVDKIFKALETVSNYELISSYRAVGTKTFQCSIGGIKSHEARDEPLINMIQKHTLAT